MTKDKGGPAFTTTHKQYGVPLEGISLRDWFAGQALVGIGSHIEVPFGKTRIEGYNWDHMAECAYRIADAMIQEGRHKDAV